LIVAKKEEGESKEKESDNGGIILPTVQTKQLIEN
jgi:hypothetical protein